MWHDPRISACGIISFFICNLNAGEKGGLIMGRNGLAHQGWPWEVGTPCGHGPGSL